MMGRGGAHQKSTFFDVIQWSINIEMFSFFWLLEHTSNVILLRKLKETLMSWGGGGEARLKIWKIFNYEYVVIKQVYDFQTLGSICDQFRPLLLFCFFLHWITLKIDWEGQVMYYLDFDISLDYIKEFWFLAFLLPT